jgi:hypothetical protein
MAMLWKKWTKDKLGRGYMRYLALYALLIIPLYTWLFATKESPFYFTMSMIGNMGDHRINFIIWGIVTGFLITFYIARMYMMKSFKNPRAHRLLIWSHLFLVLTVIVPAVDTLPFLKQVHALMAVLFGLSLLTSLYLFIRYLGEIDEKLSTRSTWMLFTVLLGSIGLFFLLGNTGVFEIFFFFSLTLFLALMRKWLKPHENRI